MILSPLDDKIRENLRARYQEQFGMILANALLPSAIADYESALARQSALYEKKATLDSDLAAAHERERLALEPLVADLARADAARDRVSKAIEAAKSFHATERAPIENALFNLRREIFGLPIHKEPAIAAAPPAPPRRKLFEATLPTLIRALRRLCAGPGVELQAGETAQVEPDAARWLAAIGAAKVVPADRA